MSQPVHGLSTLLRVSYESVASTSSNLPASMMGFVRQSAELRKSVNGSRAARGCQRSFP